MRSRHAGAPPLRARGDAAPTVAGGAHVGAGQPHRPVRDLARRRSASASAILLSSSAPASPRRGEDLNALLRRANPTLGAVRDVVGTLDDQKRELQAALTDAEQVTRELVREPGDVREAIDAFADASTVTARRGEELRAGVRELPATLDALRPALRRLDALSREGTPLARRLARAAPQTTRVLEAIPPVARRAGPAVRALGTTARRARPTVRTARPLVRRLARFAGAALPTGDELSRLLDDLRDEDAVRHLLSFIYRAGAATSRFDATSHLLPSGVVINNCGLFATTTDPACDANYTRTAAPADRRSKDRQAGRPAARRDARARGAGRRARHRTARPRPRPRSRCSRSRSSRRPSTACSAAPRRSSTSCSRHEDHAQDAREPAARRLDHPHDGDRRGRHLLQREPRPAVRPHLRRPGRGARRGRARLRLQRGPPRRRARGHRRPDRRDPGPRRAPDARAADARPRSGPGPPAGRQHRAGAPAVDPRGEGRGPRARHVGAARAARRRPAAAPGDRRGAARRGVRDLRPRHPPRDPAHGHRAR